MAARKMGFAKPIIFASTMGIALEVDQNAQPLSLNPSMRAAVSLRRICRGKSI
jgi:hypothetical protein